MWISWPVCLVVVSGFVVPPTSSPFHKPRRAPGLRRCSNPRRMSVEDDDTVGNPTIFRPEEQVKEWLKTVEEANPSVIPNLKDCFGAGPVDEAWLALFPQEYQNKLSDDESTLDLEFATFLDVAKSSLMSVRENEAKDAILAKQICLWIDSLRKALIGNADGHGTSVSDRRGNGGVSVERKSSEESASKRRKEKKTLIEAESEARQLVLRDDSVVNFDMTLYPRDKPGKSEIDLLSKTTESFKETEKWRSISFRLLRVGKVEEETAGVACDEENLLDAEDLRLAFIKLGLSRKTKKDMVRELVEALERMGEIEKSGIFVPKPNQDDSKQDDSKQDDSKQDDSKNSTVAVKYVHGLVELSGTEGWDFNDPPGKSEAIIVAGESGSGKTTFSKYGVRPIAATKYDDLSCTGVLYFSLDQEAMAEMDKMDKMPDTSTDSDVVLSMLISRCLRSFVDNGEEKIFKDPIIYPVYNSISSLSSVLNKERNRIARSVFDDTLSRFVGGSNKDYSREVEAWWNGELDLVLDGLVIVVDEVGRSRTLARGLIDIARTITGEVVQGPRQRAKHCKIVLAGTGLDDIDENFQELTGMTDPLKGKVVIAKRVDFNSSAFKHFLSIKNIEEDELLNGTISSVLAENTRMLVDALVPTLRSDPLSYGYDGPFRKSLRTEHRIEAGSSRFLMNYAARVFVRRNGLKNLEDRDGLDRIFQDAFVFFAREAVKGILADKLLVGAARRSVLDELSNKTIDEKVFKFGVANRGEPTSRAMQFISCLGVSFALVDGDGYLFENALAAHLCRLSTCLGRNQLGTYQLRTGVPNGNRVLNHELAEKEVKEIRSKLPEDADDIHAGCPWSLVLLNFENAAGPDTMELQVYVNEKGGLEGTLDLYQQKFRGTGSQKENLLQAACSLGRDPDDLGFPDHEKEDYRTNAENSGKALNKFVDFMGKEFDFTIAIRRRVLVVKQNSSDLKRSTGIVFQSDVTVWSSEFLEPSAFVFPTVAK